MKPLYLEGRAGMRVDYDEPALVVSAPDRSALLFPLSRVSRVVVCGYVDWSMTALFACADAGIAVLFMTESGGVRSRWLGEVENGPLLLSQFGVMLRRPEALPRYQDWYAGMRRMAVRSAARRLRFADWQSATADSLEGWLRRTLPQPWFEAAAVLRGFLLSVVLGYLADFGLESGDSGVHWGAINLADDLADLLLWDFYPLLLSRHGRGDAVPDKQRLAAVLQQREVRCQQLLRGLLNRLHQCLLRVA